MSYSKEELEKELINEINYLQNKHYGIMEEAMYYLNGYHAEKSRAEPIENEINAYMKQLRELNPNTEFELDSDYL